MWADHFEFRKSSGLALLAERERMQKEIERLGADLLLCQKRIEHEADGHAKAAIRADDAESKLAEAQPAREPVAVVYLDDERLYEVKFLGAPPAPGTRLYAAPIPDSRTPSQKMADAGFTRRPTIGQLERAEEEASRAKVVEEMLRYADWIERPSPAYPDQLRYWAQRLAGEEK